MGEKEVIAPLDFVAWRAGLGDIHLPRWQELPEIGLYMDQVLVLLEMFLAKLSRPGEKLMTASMINNYVKQGLIPKPEKKKYQRLHIAHLVVITLFKQLATLTDIKAGIGLLNQRFEPAILYDMFCEEQEQALRTAAKRLAEVAESPDGEKPQQLMLNQAAAAAAAWIAAKGLLDWQCALTPAPDQPLKVPTTYESEAHIETQ